MGFSSISYLIYTLLQLGVKEIDTVVQYGVMRESIRIKLGRKIKHYRNKCGYTQERLSELADIDYKYLQRIEGRYPPALKIDTIEKIAKALGISAKNLMP